MYITEYNRGSTAALEISEFMCFYLSGVQAYKRK